MARKQGTVLDSELVAFQAEVRRLALAIVEQVLAAELARVNASLPTRADLARAAADARRSRR